jgi:regulator of sigma E protease
MLIFIFVLFAWVEIYLPTANVKYGIVSDSVGYALGLRNGDKIISVDNQHIENFQEITSDIVLNNRKTIQIERDGAALNIYIPKEYVPKMLKGKGKIEPRMPFGPYVISIFVKGSHAKASGVLMGDQLVGLNDKQFTYFDEFQKYLFENRDQPVVLNLLRKGDVLNITTKPDSLGLLGIGRSGSADQIFDFKTLKYGFFQSFPAGIDKGLKTISDYLKQFKLIFSKHTKAYESLGGFITIGSIFPDE